ncbi:MAG: hypothetical protein AAF697_11455 [Pseudomonadota bacterium]
MKSTLAALGLALAGMYLTTQAPLAAQESETGALSADDKAAIEDALRLGEAIYRHDQAAWHTTDAMVAAVGDPGALGIRGWIVNEIEGGHEVVFFRPLDEGFEAAWSANYDGSRVTDEREYKPGARPFTEAEAAMANARMAPFSVDTDYALCSDRLNTVVLPSGKANGALYAYLLAPQPTLDQIPFGGHFRFEVVDGKVIDHRRFTNSCLTMSLPREGEPRPVAMAVTHLLDATPTEVHVFSAYVAQMPISVLAVEGDRNWWVELVEGKPNIRLIRID